MKQNKVKLIRKVKCLLGFHNIMEVVKYNQSGESRISKECIFCGWHERMFKNLFDILRK